MSGLAWGRRRWQGAMACFAYFAGADTRTSNLSPPCHGWNAVVQVSIPDASTPASDMARDNATEPSSAMKSMVWSAMLA